MPSDIRVLNSLESDQALCFLRPDLGPNCVANVISRGQKLLQAVKS